MWVQGTTHHMGSAGGVQAKPILRVTVRERDRERGRGVQEVAGAALTIRPTATVVVRGKEGGTGAAAGGDQPPLPVRGEVQSCIFRPSLFDYFRGCSVNRLAESCTPSDLHPLHTSHSQSAVSGFICAIVC